MELEGKALAWALDCAEDGGDEYLSAGAREFTIYRGRIHTPDDEEARGWELTRYDLDIIRHMLHGFIVTRRDGVSRIYVFGSSESLEAAWGYLVAKYFLEGVSE